MPEIGGKALAINTDARLIRVCLIFGSLPVGLQGCSGDERVLGRAMADVLSRQDKQVVMEGQEPAAFWAALGGKVPYASDKR